MGGWATSRATEGSRPGLAPSRVESAAPVVAARSWFEALAGDKRPSLPLPRGLKLGKNPNET